MDELLDIFAGLKVTEDVVGSIRKVTFVHSWDGKTSINELSVRASFEDMTFWTQYWADNPTIGEVVITVEYPVIHRLSINEFLTSMFRSLSHVQKVTLAISTMTVWMGFVKKIIKDGLLDVSANVDIGAGHGWYSFDVLARTGLETFATNRMEFTRKRLGLMDMDLGLVNEE